MAVVNPPQARSAAAPRAAALPGTGARLLCGGVGAVLAASAAVLPLWHARLVAPQYPGGLRMAAYGHQVTGDVEEIDILNHYVGMKAFDPADVPEMALWPLVVALAVAAAVIGAWAGRRWFGRLARLVLWATPLGILADIQLRLHQYGHDLEPVAALRIPEFTPVVVGPSTVMNFTTWAYPGAGIAALLLAAATATFGPRLLTRLGRRSAIATTMMAALVLTTAAPAWAADLQAGPGSGHDHSEHVRTQAQLPGSGGDPTAKASATGPTHDGLAERLESAVPGEQVILAPGTYKGNVVIDVPVVLTGRGLPTIVGDGSDTTLTIRAPGTVVQGIRVQGSGVGPGGSPAGISIQADDVTISEVVVEDAYVGIAVTGARGVRLLDSCVTGRASAMLADDGHASGDDGGHGGAHDAHVAHAVGGPAGAPRGDGISLWDADAALVRGNHISDARDGIYVSFGSETLLDANEVRDSRYAVHTMSARHLTLAENHFEGNLSGAVVMYGGPAFLLRNTFRGNRSPSTGFGLLIKDVSGAEVVENVIVANRVGVHVDGVTGADDPVRVTANTVALNQVGVAVYPAANASFAVNSFVQNLVQVMPQGGEARGARWSERGSGNYWSTYRGYARADGSQGAVPHAEGGSVEHLLTRSPVLTALASGPALRLLRAMEERWSVASPVAVDDLPLVRPHSPGVASSPGGASLRLGAGTASLALVLGAAALLIRLRSPRPMPVAPGRT
jgi:nitrous oxidase accessory protein